MTWFKISCLSSADKDGWDGFSITALLMASAPGIDIPAVRSRFHLHVTGKNQPNNGVV